MKSNIENIQKYCAKLETEKPDFGTDEDQRKEVACLLQANKDLMQEYLALKWQIEKTNLETSVSINGNTYTISEMLVIKRKLGKHMVDTFKALSKTHAQHRLSYHRTGDGNIPAIVQYYKEDERNKSILKWQNLVDEIDSRLEVINATTELVS